RRSCSECQYRWATQAFCNRREAKVVGTEIVAPLTNAVRFVDYEEADVSFEKVLEEVPVLESLGSQIEQLTFAFANLAMRLARFESGEMRMHTPGGDATHSARVF